MFLLRTRTVLALALRGQHLVREWASLRRCRPLVRLSTLATGAGDARIGDGGHIGAARPMDARSQEAGAAHTPVQGSWGCYCPYAEAW